MARLGFMRCLALGLCVVGVGVALAGDRVVVDVDTDKAKEDVMDASREAGRIGKQAKKEGLRIADKAEDFAEEVADSFSEGWDDEPQWD